MPRLREGSLPLVGKVIDLERLTEYDNEAHQRTNKPDGVRLTVKSALGGICSVKLPQNALGEVPVPEEGDHVAYVVQYGAYADNGGRGESFVRFIKELTPGDLDLLASQSGLLVK